MAMEVASRYVPDYIMPSPLTVSKAIWKLAATDYTHVLITLSRLSAAMLFSMISGIILGLIMGMSPLFRPFIRSLIIIDTGIPALSGSCWPCSGSRTPRRGSSSSW
jgi:NitT/TauT family transport system permease protein